VADHDAGGLDLVGGGDELVHRPAPTHLECPVDSCAGHQELAIEVTEHRRLGLGDQQRSRAGSGEGDLVLDVDAQDPAPSDDRERQDVLEETDPTDAGDADDHDRGSRGPGVFRCCHAPDDTSFRLYV
jgi:hypothetical protein